MDTMNKVLVVAENSFQLALMSDLLEANGLKTVRATTTKEAIELAEDIQPQMVVVDVALPRNGSSKVLERLRARRATRDIPVVAVADRTQEQEAQRVIDQCFTACVDKPISTTGFTRSVMREMHRYTCTRS